jgi:hypothetical protein
MSFSVRSTPGWTKHTDKLTSIPYYTSKLTRESQWNFPEPYQAVSNMPALPRSAQVLYCSQLRRAEAGLSAAGALARWRAASTEEKSPFQAEAKCMVEARMRAIHMAHQPPNGAQPIGSV